MSTNNYNNVLTNKNKLNTSYETDQYNVAIVIIL